jgi:hypothetical protein
MKTALIHGLSAVASLSLLGACRTDGYRISRLGTGGWPQDGCFRVIAGNALGGSEPSNVSCAQAPEGLPGGASVVSPTVPIAGPPQRPPNVVTDRRGFTNPAPVKRASGGTR